jgi:Holliday junction DNA helicase RuvB
MKKLSTTNRSADQKSSLKPDEEDKNLDLTLRPERLNDYIGQEKLKKNIRIIIEAAKKRKEPIEHLLFYGGSGLGKTTISHIIAKELGANIRIVSGPVIEKVGDLAAILTNLNQGDILFCDEIHRLNKLVEEFIYPALENFKLNLVLGKGPMARTMELKLPRFTLIGATTRLALLSSPLRSRFGAIFQLNLYRNEDIEKILQRSSRLLKIEIEPKAVKLLAQCSRFTPRIANRLLKRARDFAQTEGQGKITEKIVKQALALLEIDELGLESGDRKILEAIITKFKGGPVGLQALAAVTSEEADTILDVYEPYLMKIGFVERTPRGRIATKAAYQYLNLKGLQRLL